MSTGTHVINEPRMDYRFTDLVDIDKFHRMLASFYQATGILHGLVDHENKVISAIGWQEACTDFHRQHPLSNTRCLESNCYLSEHLHQASFVGSTCKNGLVDYATPIVIEGKQLATLYFGQILHEAPDLDYFRKQARECGFEKESYLAAIRKVPVIPRERIEPIMAFYVELAQMLAEAGLDRLRQRDAEQRLAVLNQGLEQAIEQRTEELAAKNQLLTREVAERRRTERALRDSQKQLQTLLDSSPTGIGMSDVDGKITYINRKFIELFGYDMEDLATVEDWYRLAYPDKDFRDKVVRAWAREAIAAKSGERRPPILEAPIRCKNGDTRYVIITLSWVDDYRLVNFSDITGRWLAERRDRARNATLELIAKAAPLRQILHSIVLNVQAEDQRMLCSILLLDGDGRHLRNGAAPNLPDFYNQAIDGVEIGYGVGSCGTAAHTRQRVIVADIQRHPHWAAFKDLAASAGLASCWSEPILSSKGRLLGTFAIYHRQPSEPNAAALELIGHAANLASIAIERHLADAELEHQAHTDFLTELANRRRFIELATTEVARAQRYRTSVSLIMFDIDHFKAVNDRYGHKTGDNVLHKLAATVRQTLRDVDIAGRLGGEEFAVMLPETGAKAAWDAAERLRLAIAGTEMQAESAERFHVTISMGIATLTDAACDIETLLKNADEALYTAKNNGRDQVCCFPGVFRSDPAGYSD
ncbi:diguanylate cyclase [Methylomonas sp. SURF-2]|uniref:diguanylate cyclase n=1 Tax=Methylomonas subterranea TaxID=2952225 RepID=A0ABT1TBX1_9GAMM|nr:diguanylate cyclase [Methylomonas sp. SURF-2]MCQ8102768.1 diguanylate cyclase [Methylomonas sp. SURF-2]